MIVGGEEEDKASGVLEENAGGKGNDEPVEQSDAEEEALDRSLGIPYKKNVTSTVTNGDSSDVSFPTLPVGRNAIAVIAICA